MTVSTTDAFSGPYAPNGATTVFPFTFDASTSADVVVLIDNEVVDDGAYDVTINDNGTGSVTFSAAPTGAELIVALNPTFEQQVAFTNGGPFLAKSHGQALDEAARRAIYLNARQLASIRAPIGETMLELPPKADRANSVLGFDAEGNPTKATSPKGDPGGNVDSIGLFSDGPTIPVSPGTDRVQTSGHGAVGVGAASYVYDPTVDAAYVAAWPHVAFISANGRGFRIDVEQRLTPQIFGVKTGSSLAATKNANRDRLVAMEAYLRASGTATTYYRGTYAVYWPKGDYYFSDPGGGYFNLKSCVHFIGDNPSGGIGGAGAPATRLFFEKGGFRVERYNTLNGAAEGVPTTGADTSRFRGLYMTSAQARPAAGVYAAQATSGILAYGTVYVEDCQIEGFTRDGISLESGAVSGVGDANVDCSVLRNNRVRFNGRHGIYLDGVDANACVIDGVNDVSFNNNYGIYDSSFLGNHISGPHASGNGIPTGASKHDGLTSVVTYPAVAGSLYTVAPGQAVAASMTQPGTNPAVWVAHKEDLGVATPTSLAPLWVNGTTYKEGGSYFYDGIVGVEWINCYAESRQGQPYMGQFGTMRGGSWEKHPLSTGGYARGFGDRYTYDCSVEVTMDLRLTGAGRVHDIGPKTGTGADTSTSFNAVTSGHRVRWAKFNADGTLQGEIGYAWGVHGSGLFLSGSPSLMLRSGDTNVAEVKAAGIDMQAGKTIYFASLTNAANDAAAASAGVAVGTVYRNGSALMVRVA